MALRVLLADESTTIKKVMQLALQDFAVEVKSVQSGIDVLEVAKAFKPDIIFADVLLQKKNGYEVCADLKNSQDVGEVPVVLMWSSFMELDERQAQASRADRRLEKPFDVENLRQIVLELVPKTRSQRLAHFLQFPESMTEPLREEESAKRASPPPRPTPPTESSADERTLVVPRTQEPAVPRTQGPQPAQSQAKNTPPATSVPQKPKSVPQETVVPEPPLALEIETPGSTQPAPSGWNMNSFDDIQEFAHEVEGDGPSLSVVTNPGEQPTQVATGEPILTLPEGADEEPFEFQSNDDAFQTVRITSSKPTPLAQRPAPQPRIEEDDLSSQPTLVAGDEVDEVWSHKSLSGFKLDIDPAAESTGPVLTLEEVADIPESLEHGEFLRHEPRDESMPSTPPGFTDIQESAYALPDEDESLPASGGAIPALSSEQLERIIRAQSKDIIETVVRRMVREVVPDLAQKIIREELDRLLAEP